MKLLLSFFTFYFLLLISYSQSVGIGTNAPNASAQLDISSTTKGLLIPRMSNTQMNAIVSPAAGLMVFNLTDSVFYVRKNSGWTKLIPPLSVNTWSANGNNIYNSNTGNIGIGTSNPAHARMEVNGTIGAAVAMFGADKFGVTIEADNPEVGFNYFYNNGPKTIKTGYASVIGMAPGTGEMYLGNYNGNKSSTDFGAIDGYRQNITLFQDGEFRLAGSTYFNHFFFGSNEDTYIRGGKNGSNVLINDVNNGRVGIGTGTPRVSFEQQGVIGNTSAIFGGEGTGVSLQRDWPAIGLNHWYDGSTHRAIGIGYGAQIAVDQNIGASGGAITFTTFSPRVNAINGPLLNQKTNVFIQNGRIGVGTNVPYADLHIIQRKTTVTTVSDEDVDLGITMEGNLDYGGGFGGSSKWNIHVGRYFADPFTYYEGFSFWHESGNTGWYNVAGIGANGQYYQFSDKKLKKDISYLGNGCLDKIIQLKPASYHFIKDKSPSQLDYGFIAQDVEKIFPGFVATFSKNKMIAYSSFIPILTKGMQEQQQQIEELKNEIAELKKLILAKK